MSRIKILHLIKSLGRGGAEMLLPETILHHDRASFEFHCIYFLPWKDQMVRPLQEAGAVVVCLAANNNLLMMTRVWRLVNYVKTNKIQVIHCHLPWAGVLGRIVHQLTGVPVIYTEHNKLERYHFLTRQINLFTLGWNNSVLAVSREVAASIKKWKGSNFEVQTLLNGVDTAKYTVVTKKEKSKMSLGIPPESLVVGNVCVFRIQKRLIVWLEIAAAIIQRHPSTRFILVGDGPLKDEVNQKIDQLGIRENMLLPGLQVDVRPYLSAMDVFMISSLFEGLPVALLEAMAMELPVVATAAGGIPEVIVDGDSGWTVPVDDPQQLTGAVLRMLENEDLRASLGKSARKRIEENYSIQRMVKELEKVYREVLIGR